MSTTEYPVARENSALNGINWDTAVIVGVLCNGANVGGQVLPISIATTSNPVIVEVTGSTAANWRQGDTVCGYRATGMLMLNGTFILGPSVGANQWVLLTPNEDGRNAISNTAYTGGGVFANLTNIRTLADVSNTIVQISAPITDASVDREGVLNAAVAAVFGPLTLVDADWISYCVLTGNPANSPMIWHRDGRYLITSASDVTNGATHIWQGRRGGGIECPIAAGTVLSFNNGVNATVTGDLEQGTRDIVVNAIAGVIPAGYTADAPAQVLAPSTNLPLRGYSAPSLTELIDTGPLKFGKV